MSRKISVNELVMAMALKTKKEKKKNAKRKVCNSERNFTTLDTLILTFKTLTPSKNNLFERG